MASPSSNPSDPTSLICAACDCHRNFHRRLHHHSPPPQQLEQKVDDDKRESPSAANGDTDVNNNNNNSAQIQSTRESGGTTIIGQKYSSRKRFRSGFEQKERRVVEESCREIGVDKGVFKVWSHFHHY